MEPGRVNGDVKLMSPLDPAEGESCALLQDHYIHTAKIRRKTNEAAFGPSLNMNFGFFFPRLKSRVRVSSPAPLPPTSGALSCCCRGLPSGSDRFPETWADLNLRGERRATCGE